MTRQKWATKEQEAWLEERKAAFFSANQKKAAAKEFFPTVLQEFRDKWPVPQVTEEEINKAGSLELATKAQKDKYDKVHCPITSEGVTNHIPQRTSSWFHNKSRAVNGTKGILKVIPAPRPKKLQAWQAYHALTYQSQWKPHIDTAWSEYQEAWTAEHPTEKPEKNRFQIMIEFIKQKYNEESEEMKKKCEEYRDERPEDRDSTPVKLESDINADFQA
jgi:hypothetical protein